MEEEKEKEQKWKEKELKRWKKTHLLNVLLLR